MPTGVIIFMLISISLMKFENRGDLTLSYLDLTVENREILIILPWVFY